MDSVHTQQDQDQTNNRDVSFDGIFITSKRVDALPQRTRPPPRAREVQPRIQVTTNFRDEAELNPYVPAFETDIQYYLCISGYFVGFGNFLVFPYLVIENGGAAFLIPYTIATVFVVCPLFMLETAWGQLIRSKLDKKYSMIDPRLWGIGMAMAVTVGMTLVYYAVLFPWTLNYFFNSFQNPLPWTSMQGPWNPEYFHDGLLRRAKDSSEQMLLVPSLFLCLIMTYFIIYFTVWKGLKTSSHIVYITVPVPLFLLSILLIKGVSLDGADLGLNYLFVPEWEKLKDPKIWERALTQAFFQTGLVYGPVLLYATARRPSKKIVASSIWLPFLDYLISLMSAVSLFSYIGYVAKLEDKPISELTQDGLDLAFIAYPGLMTTLHLSNFWSAVFFMMMLMIGIDTVVGMLDFCSSFFFDFLNLKGEIRRPYLVLLITGSLFAIDLVFVTNYGWYFFMFMAKNVGGFGLIFVMLAETLTISQLFGFEKLNALLRFRTGEEIPKVFRISTTFIAVPSMAILLISSIYQEVTVDTDEPLWQLYLGRLFKIVPIICCLLGLCVKRKTPTVDAIIQRQCGKSIEQLVEDSLKQRKPPQPEVKQELSSSSNIESSNLELSREAV